MPDYKKAKIYQIVDYTTNKVYIGSTCQSLAQRLAGHTSNYNAYVNGNAQYMTSFDILANGNYDILLIKSFPCENKEELNKEEGHHIRTIQCVNKNISGRTQKESLQNHRANHKAETLQYNAAYYSKNKAILQNKASAKVTCDCGKTISHGHKTRHALSKRHMKYEDVLAQDQKQED